MPFGGFHVIGRRRQFGGCGFEPVGGVGVVVGGLGDLAGDLRHPVADARGGAGLGLGGCGELGGARVDRSGLADQFCLLGLEGRQPVVGVGGVAAEPRNLRLHGGPLLRCGLPTCGRNADLLLGCGDAAVDDVQLVGGLLVGGEGRCRLSPRNLGCVVGLVPVRLDGGQPVPGAGHRGLRGLQAPVGVGKSGVGAACGLAGLVAFGLGLRDPFGQPVDARLLNRQASEQVVGVGVGDLLAGSFGVGNDPVQVGCEFLAADDGRFDVGLRLSAFVPDPAGLVPVRRRPIRCGHDLLLDGPYGLADLSEFSVNGGLGCDGVVPIGAGFGHLRVGGVSFVDEGSGLLLGRGDRGARRVPVGQGGCALLTGGVDPAHGGVADGLGALACGLCRFAFAARIGVDLRGLGDLLPRLLGVGQCLVALSEEPSFFAADLGGRLGVGGGLLTDAP